MARKNLPRRKSKKVFQKGNRVHPVNDYRPYRGGIRL